MKSWDEVVFNRKLATGAASSDSNSRTLGKRKPQAADDKDENDAAGANDDNDDNDNENLNESDNNNNDSNNNSSASRSSTKKAVPRKHDARPHFKVMLLSGAPGLGKVCTRENLCWIHS